MGFSKLTKRYRTILKNLEDFEQWPIEALNVVSCRDFLILWSKKDELPEPKTFPK